MPRDGRDIVAVGASAGGVEALAALAAGLPGDLAAAVLVVLHVSPTGISVLPEIMGRAGPLPAAHAVDGEPARPGRIYVAPPDHHLVLQGDALQVTRGPRENGHRPAVDTLFRSVAESAGARAVGVVLSGALDDGAAGLLALRGRGGVGVVQDPEDAATPGMPASAIRYAGPELVLPMKEIGPAVARLVDGARPPAAEDAAMPPDRQPAEDKGETTGEPAPPGHVSIFTCPDCGGTLWESELDILSRFECRVGHAYSSESLFAAQTEALEGAMWAAVRALEERADMAVRLARRLDASGHPRSADRYQAQAADAEERADLVRRALLELDKGDRRDESAS